ncbi:ABC transporter permease [Sanguibacter antarcticus]|uniref:ABC-2 type transport system permease protein n=1 Tax=Sanguibacter antarcticus TaxID=372484 RepID=A0A2A9E1T1_9MICO|nr:ABC transporter permease [Sanguibacter antarcticus]PFG32325.1 ABC-2 type transport system permease protein [Sanguibacter antarcticus]
MSAGDRSSGTWDAVRLVAGREIVQRARTKSFVWTTVVLLVLIVAATVGASFVIGSEKTLRVGVTEQTASLAGAITATTESLGPRVEVDTVTDADGRARVADESLDALVVGTADDFSVVAKTTLDIDLTTALSVLDQQAALAAEIDALGGDPDTVSAAVASAALDVESLEPPPEVDGSQILAAYVVGILLFVALQTCGQMVAQGVVEEKTSRVVELLLATLRPWQLMTGKVAGIGAIGLAQVALLTGTGVAASSLLGLTDSISVDLGSTALWATTWFVVGFTMYALLFAALAALVSRQEEVASVTSPVLVLMMLPYIVGVSVAPWAPDNPLVAWLSYLPFTSPLIMPIRVALGAVPDWQVFAVLAGNLAVVPFLVWFSSRVYSNAVLRTGSRIKVRDAFKAA